ncbi:hypothetical protein DFH06DRAFT_1097587 [Mycena polygramma]|nr:hypothetical protein DFH06DRAFT_1097587 [Mycena polygramma]
MLHRAAALEALFDAADRFDQPRCHTETRTELLDELYAWAIHPDSTHSIRWLHGPAGAGKSAIMQSLCQRLQDAGRLGGSFFFKRGHAACGNAKMLFATLAYQLALSRRELKSVISSSVEMDPSVLGRGMDVQFRVLILEPCRLLNDGIPSVLLIDGLDECDGHHIQQEILRLIRPAARCSLRILVASRPEPHIRETLDDSSFQGLVDITNVEQSFDDVRTYLRKEFLRIHGVHQNTMSGVPTPWPAADILEKLVKKSSGYFIYASTVIKFVDDRYSRPTQRLNIICNLAPQDSQSPFATLDHLYFQILSEVPVHSRRLLCDILSFIINAPRVLDAPGVDELLDLEPGDTDLILRPLHSVVRMPSPRKRALEVYHASFADFLVNKERSSIFHVGSQEHHIRLTSSILKALAFTYEQRGDIAICWEVARELVDYDWSSYVTGLTPSADLAPLVERINPDLIFYHRVFYDWSYDRMKNFSKWLKKMNPPPQHLVDRWEDFRLIGLYEALEQSVMLDLIGKHPLRLLIHPLSAPAPAMIHALHARINQFCKENKAILQAFGALLSQSPSLLRVLRARRLILFNLTRNDDDDDNDKFFQPFLAVRILLDISWEDILQCIRSLRPFVTRASHNFPLLFLLHPALCQLDGLYPDDIAARDLGCAFLRLIKRVQRGQLPKDLWENLMYLPMSDGCTGWGRHVRSAPPADPEILWELGDFSPIQSFAGDSGGLSPCG